MDTQHPTPQPPPGLEPLLSIEELATYLGIPISTLYDWRVRGHGPRAHRFGKHLKFALSDVRAWMATQREPEPAAEPASLDRG
ncbi:helix-turn-helix domain-containing protein [Leucobacter chromiireducens]|uniref:helix-turn-helix domain-containing protein n=1 Tax=Leucobacter chromiireducens TaxID=283877 RepID=UPI000F632C7D|nr:helix-turn-helix domain-containing protein [Leucobacter chromiireducens]